MSGVGEGGNSNSNSSNRTNGGEGGVVLYQNQQQQQQRQRLRLNPNMEHKADNYEDISGAAELGGFSPHLFSSLETYLPPSMLTAHRHSKLHFLSDILFRYSPLSERARPFSQRNKASYEIQPHNSIKLPQWIFFGDSFLVYIDEQTKEKIEINNGVQKHKEYRQKIISNYQPLHRELYKMNPTNFFVPSFIRAINENTEESFRNIMTEPSPGIFAFEMLQPRFCELLLSEVENFEKWVHETKFRIMRPNTMNKFGAVLDDFGLEGMLDKLMEDFIRPMSGVFFPEVGGSTLDTHHGFVVEYGINRDVDLDDAEVSLNVCLGKQFSGGDLFFRGIRCEKHVHTGTQPDETFDYSHVQGRAVLHRGRHRHGARATTSGHRINLLLWCRSSIFRELRNYQKDFSSWCGECQREKRERQTHSIAALKLELLKREEEAEKEAAV